VTGYTLRRAGPHEAATITAHRRAMFAEMAHTAVARLDEMAAAFTPWVAERLERGEYLAWFAETELGEVVGGAGLWLMDWPPHVVGRGARRGNILNVYVAPRHRRQGLARRLMDATLAWCSANALDVVILHASDDGRPLYEALGFTPTNEMRRVLAED
jgi:GNAT superfamily N-acetyltransferase